MRDDDLLGTDGVLDALPNGVFAIDRDTRITAWNRAMRELTGYEAAEVLGQPCSILQGDRCFLGPVEHGLRPCLLFQEGEVPGRRCRVRRKDGTFIPVLKHGRVLRGADGAVVGAVESVSDLTTLVNLEEELERLRVERGECAVSFHGLVGRSAAMLRLYDLLRAAASSDAGVLVLGETGTGKELVAAALHAMGRRARGPFIRVSCAALPESLLETELFGHVRGAFTGAVAGREGRFEAADGGTLFLDEIGDISPAVQVKLLRVLEEQVFERVGSNRPVRVNFRLIAATNRDLEERVRAGAFRQDLYYRLAVVPVAVPPLRDRTGDIPTLVEHLLGRVRRRDGRDRLTVEADALRALERHGWPGNVRELEHALEYAAVRATDGHIDVSCLPAAVQRGLGPSDDAAPRRRARPTDEEIHAALLAESGHRERAARRLGVSRMSLWKWLREAEGGPRP